MSREQIVAEPGDLGEIDVVDAHHRALADRTAGNDDIAFRLQHAGRRFDAVQLAEHLERRLGVINPGRHGRAASAATLTASAATAAAAASAVTAAAAVAGSCRRRSPLSPAGAAAAVDRFGRAFPHRLHDDVRAVFIQRAFRRIQIDRSRGRSIIYAKPECQNKQNHKRIIAFRRTGQLG